MSFDSIIKENKLRREQMYSPYDPILGIGSPIERTPLTYSANGDIIKVNVPVDMMIHPFVKLLAEAGSIEQLLLKSNIPVSIGVITDLMAQIIQIRFDYDFEFWAITTVRIQDKDTKKPIPFKLNRAQRKLLAKFEDMRRRKKPIRVILLKARQWGGSTLTQIYMSWIQQRHQTSWHSAIITDVENQARNILNMYMKVAKHYPSFAGKINFTPFAGSSKTKYIPERDTIISLGSAQKPDSLRSFDFAMMHLSEVGLWKDTATKTAADLAQSLQATVPNVPDTFVVIESTAKGVGNFFHLRWTDSISGRSIYEPVFVAWFEIERYQMEVPDYEDFINSWDEYEKYLWSLGATIEGIYWYRYTKVGESFTEWAMKSEYPSTATEAFQSTGRRAFAPQYVLNARSTCIQPSYMGDLYADSISGADSLKNIEFKETTGGRLWIWSLPDDSENISDRYCLFADIGGRSDKADYSVIKVLDRYWMMDGGTPEVVAVWHGHLDQDLFAWKCAQLAKYYNMGLLAVESNSLRKEKVEGDHFLTVLDEIADYYPNLYSREIFENIRSNMPVKYGFQTNKSTKPMIIDTLNKNLREFGYTERDVRACDEMDYYEIKSDGSYGAVSGQHDDHVIVTAGSNWLSSRMPLPKRIDKTAYKNRKKVKTISEASL